MKLDIAPPRAERDPLAVEAVPVLDDATSPSADRGTQPRVLAGDFRLRPSLGCHIRNAPRHDLRR
jgi:hypothetical protein